ncbi:hypothetical protein [Ekhidna sp.]|uniref:hypothetical protein n=1 Tax=Ekhidna sp. TaxID=2608089 RepID=UPI003CCC148E
MKLRNLLVIILSIVMIGLADQAEAQRRNKYKKRRQTNRKVSHYKGGVRGYGRFEPYIFVGAQINAGNYFGDLAPVNKAASTDISFTRPGFGLLGGYKFHHSMAVTAELNWVRIFGDDFASDPGSEDGFPRYARNLSFRNDIKEFRLALQIFLIPNYGGPNARLPFNAYLSIGGTVFHHEPMGKVPDFDYQSEGTDATTAAPQAGEWVKLRPLGTEGQNLGIVEPYKSISFAVPVAVGAQMRLPGTQFTAALELGLRYAFTDYLDDVSTNYVGLEQFDDPLARIMSDRGAVPVSSKGDARDLSSLRIINNHGQGHNYYIEGNVGSGIDGSRRGNPDDDDMFFMTQIKLSYVLGGTTRRRAKYR